jgi:hypothetical protein
MNKRKFEELSTNELKMVYNQNDKLQNEVLDDYIENEMFWVGEMLDYIRPYLSSCSIGFNNRNQHIRVKNDRFEDFLYGLKKLQEDMCFLPEKDAHIIQNAIDNPAIDQRNFIRRILEQFDIFTKSPSSDYLESYFLDMYVEKMNKDYYIDNNYRLYKHVEYEKSYS